MQETATILKPLSRISPSKYTGISRCPYGVALANTYSAPLLPYPPASHLGNVIHKCLQLIVTREITTGTEFDENWNRLISVEEEILDNLGFGFYTPLSENVPGYTIKKFQVKSLLKNAVRRKAPNHNQKNDTSILTEKWLQSQDSLIGGIADIIINLNGHTKLSDFKSGKILVEEGGIKEEYEEQLKLYAYLHNQTYGRYPDELSIIDLEKKEYSIAFSPEECKTLAEGAKKALSEINSLITGDKREKLAKPSRENCKSCLYRPACNFFWELPLPEKDTLFMDIKGDIVTVQQFRNGNINATLQVGDIELTVTHINDRYLSLLAELVGKKAAFYNVRQDSSKLFQALKTTKIYGC